MHPILAAQVAIFVVLINKFVIDVDAVVPIISFCAGSAHTCVVFNTKQMKCAGARFEWGSATTNTIPNSYFGDASTEIGANLPFIDVGTSIGVEQVSCGDLHVCMRLDTGDMKCLGQNLYGQAGLGITNSTVGEVNGNIGNRLNAVQVGPALQVLDIALGMHHSCAVVTGNKVKCFGYNFSGQLGRGNTNNAGSSPCDMGSELPYTNLGADVEVASIFSQAQANHNCVILSAPAASAQRIKCWGLNDKYQLGYGDTNNRGDIAGEMGSSLPLVDLGTTSTVKKLALGTQHTCALLATDALKCWGSGSNGQLSSGANATISATGNSIPTVAIDSGKTIKFIAAGITHTCIVYTDLTTIKCVGYNGNGQLGQGDATQRGATPTTKIPNIPAISLGTGALQIASIHGGRLFTCAVFVDGTVKCFGINYGQFATGTSGSIGDSAGEMGSNLIASSF